MSAAAPIQLKGISLKEIVAIIKHMLVNMFLLPSGLMLGGTFTIMD